MNRREPGVAPESIEELQRELQRVNAEIARMRPLEAGPVMDQILKMMADYSISLADLERYRRARNKGAEKNLRFRDPVTGAGWSIPRGSGSRVDAGAQDSDRQQAGPPQPSGMELSHPEPER